MCSVALSYPARALQVCVLGAPQRFRAIADLPLESERGPCHVVGGARHEPPSARCRIAGRPGPWVGGCRILFVWIWCLLIRCVVQGLAAPGLPAELVRCQPNALAHVRAELLPAVLPTIGLCCSTVSLRLPTAPPVIMYTVLCNLEIKFLCR